MSDYNGWTNYATWRVNLEVFDGMDDLSDHFTEKPEPEDVAEWAEEYANDLLEIDAKPGLALDYARAFISEVSWYEIAEHLIEYAVENGSWDEETEEEMEEA